MYQRNDKKGMVSTSCSSILLTEWLCPMKSTAVCKEKSKSNGISVRYQPMPSEQNLAINEDAVFNRHLL
jgi:hypothetical protein